MRGMRRVGGLGDLLGGGDVRMCGGLGGRVELGGLGDRGGGGWTCGGLGLLLGGGGTCSRGRDATGMEMGRGDGGGDRKRGAAGGDARRDEDGALDGGGDGLRAKDAQQTCRNDSLRRMIHNKKAVSLPWAATLWGLELTPTVHAWDGLVARAQAQLGGASVQHEARGKDERYGHAGILELDGYTEWGPPRAWYTACLFRSRPARMSCLLNWLAAHTHARFPADLVVRTGFPADSETEREAGQEYDKD
ncbi:hypothetical protein PLICRDRAFT_28221 [Plicaturopsis crispa FD-325 SS-3]|nr:hypothetical protein PLICRDRAFT_28221 [Plicaturopsis crispa FD-325 SS-3]